MPINCAHCFKSFNYNSNYRTHLKARHRYTQEDLPAKVVHRSKTSLQTRSIEYRKRYYHSKRDKVLLKQFQTRERKRLRAKFFKCRDLKEIKKPSPSRKAKPVVPESNLFVIADKYLHSGHNVNSKDWLKRARITFHPDKAKSEEEARRFTLITQEIVAAWNAYDNATQFEQNEMSEEFREWKLLDEAYRNAEDKYDFDISEYRKQENEVWNFIDEHLPAGIEGYLKRKREKELQPPNPEVIDVESEAEPEDYIVVDEPPTRIIVNVDEPEATPVDDYINLDEPFARIVIDADSDNDEYIPSRSPTPVRESPDVRETPPPPVYTPQPPPRETKGRLQRRSPPMDTVLSDDFTAVVNMYLAEFSRRKNAGGNWGIGIYDTSTRTCQFKPQNKIGKKRSVVILDDNGTELSAGKYMFFSNRMGAGWFADLRNKLREKIRETNHPDVFWNDKTLTFGRTGKLEKNVIIRESKISLVEDIFTFTP